MGTGIIVCGLNGSGKSTLGKTTVKNFGKLLESNGFVINRIYDYDRPTVLKDGEQGLANWMKQFYASGLAVMPEHIQAMIFEKVEELTRDIFWNGEQWVADYRRLRVVTYNRKENR